MTAQLPVPGQETGWPRVVDFSTHYSGPLASRELAHLGADVVKVERPTFGDGNRGLGNPLGGASDVHHTLNRGTRSVVFDRHSEDWGRFVEAITAWADVVIVGARPDDAVQRGLDFQRLRAANPEIVYCSITGYGIEGPWATRAAHGLQPDAMAGAMPVDWIDGEPVVPDSYQAHGTTLAGVWAAEGILMGLLRRTGGSGAQFVHVSIWEAALAWMWRHTQAVANGLEPTPGFQQLGPRYRMYRCADDRALLVCPIERKFWEAFVDVVGLPAEWRSRGDWDAGADMGVAHPEEAEEISRCLRARSAFEWETALSDRDVPVAVVRTVGDAIDSEHSIASGSFSTVQAENTDVVVPVPPLSVTSIGAADLDVVSTIGAKHRRRAEELPPAPPLGHHTAEILHDLGLDDLIPAAEGSRP